MSEESNPLPNTDLDRLEALASEATPGPWWVADTAYIDALGHEASSVFWGDQDGPDYSYDAVILIDGWTRPRDAAFIAAARAAIPALVREVREARAEIMRLKSVIVECRSGLYFARGWCKEPCPEIIAGAIKAAEEDMKP